MLGEKCSILWGIADLILGKLRTVFDNGVCAFAFLCVVSCCTSGSDRCILVDDFNVVCCDHGLWVAGKLRTIFSDDN